MLVLSVVRASQQVLSTCLSAPVVLFVFALLCASFSPQKEAALERVKFAIFGGWYAIPIRITGRVAQETR